jgi:hypothetical protein
VHLRFLGEVAAEKIKYLPKSELLSGYLEHKVYSNFFIESGKTPLTNHQAYSGQAL